MEEEKVLCQTPTPGKQPIRIPRWKYEAVRRAILQVIPGDEPGIPFTELAAAVDNRLSGEEKRNLGSVGWHTTVVKLDMEVKGEILRIAGAKPQRLVRNQTRCT